MPGPGIMIPSIGGFLGFLGSLGAQKQAGDVIRSATSSGGLPGTYAEGLGIFGDARPESAYSFLDAIPPEARNAFLGSIGAGIQQDPRTLFQLQQIQANQDALGRQQEHVRTGQGRIQAGRDEATTRITGRIDRANQLQEKVGARAEELAQAARRRLENPNAISPADMDAMISRHIASNRDAAAARARVADAEAARRGLSGAATMAQREDIAQANRLQNINQIANVAGINAGLRAQLEGQALGALGAAGQIGSIESDILGRGNEMVGLLTDDQFRRDMGLANLDLTLGSLEQPPEFALLGDTIAQRGDLNTQMLSGAYGADAAALSSLGNSSLGFLDSSLSRRAMREAQPSFGESLFQGVLGGTIGNITGTFGQGLGLAGLEKLGLPLPTS